MRTDVEVDGAVGTMITRTAAGAAATLTIVWQELKFQLCTTLVFSSSPYTHTHTHTCFLSPYLRDCRPVQYFVSSSPLPLPRLSLSLCLLDTVSPPFAIWKNHNTHLKVRFDVTASGNGEGGKRQGTV